MARCRHVAAPREPTRTHVGANVARRISQAKCVGPMGIVGPIDKIREGVLRPSG